MVYRTIVNHRSLVMSKLNALGGSTGSQGTEVAGMSTDCHTPRSDSSCVIGTRGNVSHGSPIKVLSRAIDCRPRTPSTTFACEGVCRHTPSFRKTPTQCSRSSRTMVCLFAFVDAQVMRRRPCDNRPWNVGQRRLESGRSIEFL